ncbi:MAG: 50S ribosomal protein L17 [Deltaproteobacteria bacterium]|nr:50S ribosomal protein L17 [Candidatus Zymogenaceae bacterium]
MRHQKAGRRLGRNTSHRKAMLRNITTSLLEVERIETTEAKAKELRRYAEKMITLGKRGDLHARRQALSFLRKRDVVEKVFSDYAERFSDRKGGYTRIMKLGRRVGDNARMAVIELLPADEKKKPKEKKKAPAAKPSKEKKKAAAPTGEKKDVKKTKAADEKETKATKAASGDKKEKTVKKPAAKKTTSKEDAKKTVAKDAPKKTQTKKSAEKPAGGAKEKSDKAKDAGK